MRSNPTPFSNSHDILVRCSPIKLIMGVWICEEQLTANFEPWSSALREEISSVILLRVIVLQEVTVSQW